MLVRPFGSFFKIALIFWYNFTIHASDFGNIGNYSSGISCRLFNLFFSASTLFTATFLIAIIYHFHFAVYISWDYNPFIPFVTTQTVSLAKAVNSQPHM